MFKETQKKATEKNRQFSISEFKWWWSQKPIIIILHDFQVAKQMLTFLFWGEGETTNASFRHNNVFRSKLFQVNSMRSERQIFYLESPNSSTSQLQKLLPSSIENGTGVVDRKASRLFFFCPGKPEGANENLCECQAAYYCNLSELNHGYLWFTLTCFCDFKEDHSSTVN